MSDFLFHFSDFHLGANWEDIGGDEYTGVANYANQLLLKHPAQLKFQKHSHLPLNNFSRIHKSLYRQNKINDEDVIGHVITGDIADKVYDHEILKEFHYDFLTKKISVFGAKIGFGLPENSIIPIIGNHDKLRITNSTLFRLSPFLNINENKKNDYTNKLDYSYTTSSKKFNHIYAFYCFDSNLYETDNIARGEISDDQIDWFNEENEIISHEFKESGKTLIRIALLHHSPYYNKPNYLGNLNIKWKELEISIGATAFINSVAEKVDLVLCGHLHAQDFNPPNICAAGTMSEWSKSEQWSFNIIAFN